MARSRARVVTTLVLASLALAGCAGADAGTTGSSADGTSGERGVVSACADPVEGFARTVDADGQPLPAPTASPLTDLPDPRELTGAAAAVVDDDILEPVDTELTPQLPVTVESCDGVTVEITDASRILAVDLHGTLAEIVFSLGLGDQVVGRDRSTGFAEAADLPLVTPGAHDLNAEAVLGLNPSVVLTDTSIGPPEVQQQLRDAGIPVIFFDDARTLDGIPTQVRAVAGALGVPEAGEELLARTQAEITEALALAPTDGEQLRIAFLYLRGGMVQLLAGPGSGADALIEAIGGVDVGTDIGLQTPFTQVTSEALINAQPDVVLMMANGLSSIGGAEGLAKIPGLAQTPAGENRRVVTMEDSVLLSFGPRTGQVVESLARAVYQPAG